MLRTSLSLSLLAPLGLALLLGGCVTTGQDVRPQAATPAPVVQRQTFVRTVPGAEVTIEAAELGLAPAAQSASAPASATANDSATHSDDDSDDDDE